MLSPSSFVGIGTDCVRETVKRVLNLPEGTNIIWRSHDDSIAQRSAIDQARHEKTHQGHEKRRVTSTDESLREKSSTGS
jgi:translation initiation factor 4E